MARCIHNSGDTGNIAKIYTYRYSEQCVHIYIQIQGQFVHIYIQMDVQMQGAMRKYINIDGTLTVGCRVIALLLTYPLSLVRV